jgi:hypothetical protein
VIGSNEINGLIFVFRILPADNAGASAQRRLQFHDVFKSNRLATWLTRLGAILLGLGTDSGTE